MMLLKARRALDAWSSPRGSLAVILLLALGLRLMGIASRQMWYDEAFSALFARSGPAAMLGGTLSEQAGAAAEEHPLLYYTLLWSWMRAWGESPAAVRGLSVLLGLGVVALAYALGRRLLGVRFGWLAGGVVALSPFQVHYAQEARMYVLMTLWILAAALALWEGMRSRRLSWWLLFGLFSALAQYTHNLSVFFLFPLAATPLWARDWRSLRAAVLSGAGALLLYLPWLTRLPAQFAKLQRGFWIDAPTPVHLLTALISFVTNLPVPEGWLPVALFAALFLTALGGWQTLRAWRARSKGVRRGLWLGYLAAAPVLMMYLFSQWQPVFIERALLPAGVFFLLWLTWSLTRTGLPRPIMSLAGVVLLAAFALGLVEHLIYRGFPYGPYAGLDAYLTAQVSPGDVILHSNKLTFLPMYYYDRDLAQSFLADPPGSGSDTLAPATQDVLGVRAAADIETAVGSAPRVWFIIFGRAIEEYRAAGEATHPHLAWLEMHYRQVAVERWDEVWVYVFESEQ